MGHTLLYLDDEAHNLDAFRRAFHRLDFVDKVLTAVTPTEAFALLEANPVSCIVTDQRMPEMNGTEFLARVIQKWPDPVRLILTGYTDVTDILEAINRGHVYYFITKPWDPHELVLTVRRALEHYEGREELKRKNRELEIAYQQLDRAHREQVNLYERVVTDDKTGVKNYHFFRIRLAEEFDRARRYGKDLGLIMIDLDDFKALNDRHGHLAGDMALREVAQLCARGQRSVDVIARYGGEEFAALLPETGMVGARTFAERVRQRIAAQPIALPSGQTVQVSVSVGVSAWPHPDVNSAEDLIQRADVALYRAKSGGKNRVMADGES
jgi:diguanylate cyclase (GGDEF)-like protein